MKCIDRLSKGYLSSSVLRRRLIIWAVALSTILVLAVGSLSLTNYVFSKIYYKERIAEFDASFSNTSTRQLNEIKSNQAITNYGISHSLKSWTYLNDNTRIRLSNIDENYMKKFGYELKEGFYPEKENEIALTETALEELGLKGSIGDTVYVFANKEETERKDFILSGIVKDRFYDSDKSKGFVSEDYIFLNAEEEMNTTIFISIHKTLNTSSAIDNVAEEAGITSEKITTMRFQTEGSLEYLLVALLIIALSVITISNIFSYSIIERINGIGLLKAVGMTTKQLKQLFKKEGLYYYIKGVPIGLILGSALNLIVLVMMYENIGSGTYSLMDFLRLFISIGIRSKVYIILLISVLFLEAIALLIAILIPSRKVKKMSIVNAIHFVDNLNVKKTKRKNSIFKNPSLKLAYVNLFNNKLKTILSILSISICIAIFIYFSTTLSYMKPEALARRGQFGDIDIHGLSLDDIESLKEMQGINKLYIRVGAKGKMPVEEVKIKDTYIEELEKFERYKAKNNDLDIQLYGYNDTLLDLQSIYINSDVDLDYLKKNEDWCLIFDFHKIGDYKIGDYLTIDDKKIKIIGTLRRLPNYWGWSESTAPALVVNMGYVRKSYDTYDTDKYSGNIASVNVNKNEYEKVKENIKIQFKDNENLRFDYIDEEIKREENAQNGMILIGYSLVIIIAAISLFMLVNSIYTSIISRKREFGMLRAIGMTRQQFHKYLNFEGNIITVCITLLGIPAGYKLGRISYDGFVNFPGNEGFEFKFPYWSLLIIVLYYFIIRTIIKVSMKRMDKETVVDLIRQV